MDGCLNFGYGRLLGLCGRLVLLGGWKGREKVSNDGDGLVMFGCMGRWE